MSSDDSQFQKLAREAAARIERQHQMGEQLSFLPDEDGAETVAQDDEEGGKVGRPKGARNKVSSQMRDYLAARGLRMPEDVLAEIAGLTSREDAITLAMQQTERVLAWAFDGAHQSAMSSPKPTAAMRLEQFGRHYAMILRAAEAIMPYTATKATPDAVINDNRTLILPAAPSAPADPAAAARDVSPRSDRRMMPANVAWQIEQNQQLSPDASDGSDDGIRTAELSHGNQRENRDDQTD